MLEEDQEFNRNMPDLEDQGDGDDKNSETEDDIDEPSVEDENAEPLEKYLEEDTDKSAERELSVLEEKAAYDLRKMKQSTAGVKRYDEAFQ